VLTDSLGETKGVILRFRIAIIPTLRNREFHVPLSDIHYIT